jgi:phosphonate transport system substrate-binding protein
MPRLLPLCGPASKGAPGPVRRRDGLRWLAGAAAASLGLPVRAQPRAAKAEYTWAVVPQFSTAELHRDWLPLVERVQRDSGIALRLHLVPGIPRFENDLLAGGPDFAYLNPYHAVMALRAHGYRPLLRDGRLLTGILVVRQDDAIRSVHELEGREVAFPAPNAFGASLWMRALLAERERVQVRPVYVQTHSNVYRQVLRGKAAAGGGVNLTLAQEQAEVRADLRVLMETPGVASHPIVAHPRVPLPVQQAVVTAVLALGRDSSAQAMLKEVAMGNPVAADYARDFQPLERYRLEKYVVLDHPA